VTGSRLISRLKSGGRLEKLPEEVVTNC
jgi:hypothetical protein